MLTRRNFVGASAIMAGSILVKDFAYAGEHDVGTVMPTKGKLAELILPTNSSSTSKHYRPAYRFGLGGVAIGNAFAPTSDEDALAALESAWKCGVRYFDTSPWYGLGLSERRFGHFLHGKKRDEYVLSTKVGRLFTAAEKPAETPIWKDPDSFNYRYEYTGDGVRRSVEDSLQRLGISSIDIVFVHDLSPDNKDFKGKWLEYFDVAAKGAFPALIKMREEGLIKAWGLGVNRADPAIKAVKESDPDIFLLATQYSLLDHEDCLKKTLPILEEKGVSVVVGSPLNAGYLAGRERFNYEGTIPDGIPKKREHMSAIASKHGIDLRTAALQFCSAPKTVSAVIPGARNAEQVKANCDSMSVEIPKAFWEELRSEKLISEDAALPA